MGVLADNLPRILGGFLDTLGLLGASGLIAFVLGTLLGAMRVAPVPVLRAIGTTYVNIFRNTPLVVLFVVFVAGLPFLGVHISFFARAVVTLSLYTAAFVCEAVRSGVNAVQVGQTEAARSIGCTFGQTLWLIVLPQAVRTVIPPLASIFIALAKNTAIAEAFGVLEGTYQFAFLVNRHASALWPLFFGTALGYILIVFVIAGIAALLERKLAVAR
ncbi:MAG TPA: amino acid ABC transporter permease [Streptosporangiales bacterium]